METLAQIQGVAAGVPYVARAPSHQLQAAPLVVIWHLMDPPRSEAAMAAALPMNSLKAWRVYLALPMSSSRMPEGGAAEFFRLASEDAILNVFGPVTDQAAGEFPAAVAELRKQLAIDDGPLGVAGGSAGSLVALEVVARAELPISAAAVVSPLSQLAPAIGRNERLYGLTYNWTEQSRQIADRHDYVRRSDELGVDLLLVVGEQDDAAFREPAAALQRKLGPKSRLVTIQGMGHALTDEPGIEPAPQNEHAAAVDAEFTAWFKQHLPA